MLESNTTVLRRVSPRYTTVRLGFCAWGGDEIVQKLGVFVLGRTHIVVVVVVVFTLWTIPVSLPSTPFVRTDPTDTANPRGHRVQGAYHQYAKNITWASREPI